MVFLWFSTIGFSRATHGTTPGTLPVELLERCLRFRLHLRVAGTQVDTPGRAVGFHMGH